VVLALWQESGNDKDRPGAGCCLRPVHGPALGQELRAWWQKRGLRHLQGSHVRGGGIILTGQPTASSVLARSRKGLSRTPSRLLTVVSVLCLLCMLYVASTFFWGFQLPFCIQTYVKAFIYFFTHPCSFFPLRALRRLLLHTVHANAHMHNCLRDVNEGTEDSAVAVTAAPNDVSAAATVVHFRCMHTISVCTCFGDPTYSFCSFSAAAAAAAAVSATP